MTTSTEQVAHLQQKLTKHLADRAMLDEQIVAIRNTLVGVNLGAALAKEERERREDTPE